MTRGRTQRANAVASTAFVALTLAAFQAGLFAPHLYEGLALLPVAPHQVAPWPATSPPKEAQDWAGTDKMVFTLPNIHHWLRSVRNDRGGLLWNPYVLGGYPFFATQDTFAFYPLNALYLGLDVVDAFLWSTLLHGFLASLFAWLALVGFGISRPGALVGAVVWGGGGWWLGHIDIINFSQAATWVPLGVWAADRCVRRPGWLGFLVLALSVALGFLSGMAQITIIGLFLAGLTAFARLLARWRPEGPGAGFKGASLALLGVLVGLLWAAPQLLPTLEIRDLSGRGKVPLAELKETSLGPLEITGLLAPELLGNPPEEDRLRRDVDTNTSKATPDGPVHLAKLAGLSDHGSAFLERVMYPGIVALMLAIGSMVGRMGWRVFAGLALCLIGLSASLGTLMLDALHLLPGFDFGSPRRLLILLTAGLALLASLGVDALSWRASRRPALWMGVLTLGPLLAILLAALFTPERLGALIAPEADATERAGVIAWLKLKSLPPLIAGGLFLPILLFGRRFGRLVFVALTLLLLLLDLATLNFRINPGQAKTETYPRTKTTNWLGEQLQANGPYRIARFHHPKTAQNALPPMPPNLPSLFGIDDVQGYEGLLDSRHEDLWTLVQPDRTMHHHLLAELTDKKSLTSPILDLLGVRYVLSANELPLPRPFVDLEERTAIYERQTALPRAFFVERLRRVEGRTEALKIMSASEFVPADEALVSPRAVGLLDLPAPSEESTWSFPRDAEAKVELVARGAAWMTLKIKTKTRTPILIAASWHPGWKAEWHSGWDSSESNDTSDVAVAPADHGLRLVMVPAGEGTLTLSFWPKSLTVGLICSTLGLAAVLGAGIIRLRRRKIPHSGSPDSSRPSSRAEELSPEWTT